jgi:hypothetical protein
MVGGGLAHGDRRAGGGPGRSPVRNTPDRRRKRVVVDVPAEWGTQSVTLPTPHPTACVGLALEVLRISIQVVGETRKCNQFCRLDDRRVTEIAEFENIREHLRGHLARLEP